MSLSELLPGQLADVQLDEAVAERPREELAAAVGAAGGVLRGEDHELRVRLDGEVHVGDVELPVVVEQPVQGLYNTL